MKRHNSTNIGHKSNTEHTNKSPDCHVETESTHGDHTSEVLPPGEWKYNELLRSETSDNPQT